MTTPTPSPAPASGAETPTCMICTRPLSEHSDPKDFKPWPAVPTPESPREAGTCPRCKQPTYDHRTLCPNNPERNPMDTILEQVSDAVHANWMESKRAAGVTTRRLESGEELMVPYAELSEQAKELDRGTVRTVLSVLPTLGYAVTRP